VSIEQELRAIRHGVAWSLLDDVRLLRIGGKDAKDVARRLVPRDLTMHGSQARVSLLLDDQGRVLADVTVARDGDDWLIFAEGMTRGDFEAHVAEALRGEATANSLEDSHVMISLNGPFAWQLMVAHEGSGTMALRYMSLFRPREDTICLRAGKTGEYGYDLLVPREDLETTLARLHELGRPFDLVRASRETLMIASLESWFFDAHDPGLKGLTPAELGLRWRTDDAAVSSRRRLCAVRAQSRFDAGDDVRHEGRIIGDLRRAQWSPTLACWIGAALIDRSLAHSGIDVFVAQDEAGRRVPLKTVSPPFVNNLSLFVQPGRHGYAQRDAIRYPGPDVASASVGCL
jgi:glycine cleavage system T protein (aminomethyltransferase)